MLKTQNSIVREAENYINQNYMRNISLDDVASYVGINKYYLSHLFKEETRENYIHYLTGIRVKNLILFIKEKNYRINELSDKVGYRDPTYCCKVVKKYTGRTINELKQLDSK